MTFKPDRFGIHFVSVATGQVVSQAEVERILELRKLTEAGRNAIPFRADARRLAFQQARERVNE